AMTMLGAALAMSIENTNNRFTRRYQEIGGREILELLGCFWLSAPPAGDVQAEPSLDLPVVLPAGGDSSDVVDWGTSLVFRSAFERDLELSGHILIDGVALKVLRYCVRVGRHIKSLSRRHPGIGTSGDVADCVAAGFARGQPASIDNRQHRRDFMPRDIMKLHVLPGCHVGDTGRRISIRNVGESFDLLGVELSESDLDPHHVQLRVATNAIDSILEPESLERIGIGLAGLEIGNLHAEALDFGLDLR